MNTRPLTLPFIHRYFCAAVWARVVLVAALACLAACNDSAASGENDPANRALEADDSGPAVVAPAQVGDAADALDLSRVAVLPGSERPSEQTVTSLVYRAPAEPDDAFKFHQNQLTTDGWKELPGSSVTPQYASAVFAKRGMHLSLVTMPNQPGQAGVTLQHHGNIRFGKLPVPNGAKPIYDGPSSAIFAVELPAEAAARETAAALRQAGWEPYGAAGPTQWFKQNAVKLAVMSVVAPAQGGKTTISFSSEMLPVDVSVPASATDVQFNNARKRLTFDVSLSQDECLAFYRESLAKKGWQTTMDAPAKIDWENVIVFRNLAKDILRLGMRAHSEGKLRVFAEHLSAAEIEEMNRKLDAQAEAYKARKSGNIERQ